MRSKAGWIGVAVYILLAIVLSGVFLTRCEEIGCLGVILIPAIPGAIVLLPFMPAPLGLLLGAALNVFLAYWIGLGVKKLITRSRGG